MLDSADGRWEGPGTPAPAELAVDEVGRFTLAPRSAVLYARRDDPAQGPYRVGG